jgi:hypothetical protein
LAIDGGGGNLVRQAGLQPRRSGDVVRLLAVLHHAAGEYVADLMGIDPRALEQLAVAGGEQRRRMGVLVAALLL